MMNLMAKQEIEKLLSQTDHTLTVDDFTLLKDLNDAGERVSNPTGEEDSFPVLPVIAGGHIFSAPTISITQWYNDRALPWWGESNYSHLALGYSLQVKITGKWLWEQERSFLEKELLSFAKGLDCTPEEYESAILSVINTDEDSGGDEGSGSANYGPLISMLCKEYGGEPDYWIHQADLNTLQSLMSSYMTGLEMEYASAKGGGKGGLPPFKTPKMAAIEKFREQSNLVERAWLENN
jgi:hypothetical protein